VRVAGEAVVIWPDPAHKAILYTSLDTPPRLDQGWGNIWYPVQVAALPIHPLGTPQPVATFTSAFLSGGVAWSQSGRYLTWFKARPTTLPSTPTGFSQLTPVPQGLGEVRWDGSKPSLAELPLPDPSQPLGFVVGGDLLTLLPPQSINAPGAIIVITNEATLVPDRATIAAANRTPTPTPAVASGVQIYDPATGQGTTLTIAFNTGWDRAGTLFQSGDAVALDDRLLVFGPDPAGEPPAADGSPAPAHLLLAQRAGGGWQVRSLGAVGVPSLPEPIIFEFFGLTPDHQAVILSRPSDDRAFPAAPGPDRATLLYRVPLDGGAWTLLGQTLPDHPILAHKPKE
jgi:hypothetical protein